MANLPRLGMTKVHHAQRGDPLDWRRQLHRDADPETHAPTTRTRGSKETAPIVSQCWPQAACASAIDQPLRAADQLRNNRSRLLRTARTGRACVGLDRKTTLLNSS